MLKTGVPTTDVMVRGRYEERLKCYQFFILPVAGGEPLFRGHYTDASSALRAVSNKLIMENMQVTHMDVQFPERAPGE